MKNKKLVPQIRFKGFSDEWENIKLSDMFIRLIKKNTDNSVKNVLTNSAEFGIILQHQFFKNEIVKKTNLNKYYIININDFTYNPRISSNAPAGPINRNKTCIGCVSPLYINFKIKTIEYINFYEIYFNSNLWNKELFYKANYGARHDRISIYENDFFNISLPITNIIEQYNISNYLGNIYTLISKKQMKLEKMKALKQTLLQKMFPNDNNSVPEIRFKDFTENWEKKKLGDIGNTYSGLTGKKKNDFGHGNALYIPYLNIFKNPIIDNSMLEPIEIDFKQNKVLYGDIFFTTSSETPEEVGMSSVWLNNLNNIYLNSFCFGYRLNNINEYNLLYFTYLLRSLFVRKKIAILAQGISRYNISKNKLMELKILFTGKQEQEKIGKYFYKLDKLINLYEKEIEKLTNLKKAFLKKMFV